MATKNMTIDASLNTRLRRVERKHERMRRNGVVYRLGSDGLIRAQPRLVRWQFPFKGLVLTAVMLVAFKALIFAQMGSGTYTTKVETLRAGTMAEQVGAFLMQEDPVTLALSGYIKQFAFQE